MPVAIKPDGTFEVIYSGPFTGVNVMMPENLIPDSSTPASNDFMFRNLELRSRCPLFTGFIASPASGGQITAVGSLGLSSANSFFCIVNQSLYTFSFGGGVWTKQSGANLLANCVWRIFNNVLYIACNNSHLATWDGTTFTTDSALVGGSGIGAVFVDELDNHLLMANTVEGLNVFPNRIRWSATSLPGTWDPAGGNPNCGSADLLDVSDAITGIMTLGRVGYILRSDGITEIAPTGQGAAPFQFNHLWANQLGLGNIKFYASAAYGNTGVILSRDNLYSVSSYDIQAIGGAARDAIMTDLSVSVNIAGLSNIFGVITPYFRSGIVGDVSTFPQRNTGATTFPYLMYMLFINQPNNSCIVWCCNLENQNSWEKYILPNFWLTGKPSLCIDAGGAPTLMMPMFSNQTATSTFGQFDPASFNDTAQGSSHSFRAEDVIPGRVCTVNRVVVTYRDLGAATISVTINGTNDNGAVVSATVNKAIGGANNNLLKTVLIYPVTSTGRPFCGFRPQLTISRAANGGPVSISTAQMFGRCDAKELD